MPGGADTRVDRGATLENLTCPSGSKLGGARPGILGRLSLRLQQLTRVDTMDVREEKPRFTGVPFPAHKAANRVSITAPLRLSHRMRRSHELAFPHIPSVCIGGEMMHERQRAVLEDVFGSVPFIRYARTNFTRYWAVRGYMMDSTYWP